MKKKAKKPLWKTLDAQRTQGEWYREENSLIIRSNYFNSIGTFDPLYNEIDETQKVANAQYTALAVNNLSILAKTLEKALETIEALATEANYTSKRWHSEHTTPIKEALNRIS